jgi:hypothetical protein
LNSRTTKHSSISIASESRRLNKTAAADPCYKNCVLPDWYSERMLRDIFRFIKEKLEIEETEN